MKLESMRPPTFLVRVVFLLGPYHSHLSFRTSWSISVESQLGIAGNGLQPADEFGEPYTEMAAAPAQGTAFVGTDAQPPVQGAQLTACGHDHMWSPHLDTWPQVLKHHLSWVGPEPRD